jgi:hypothetical protein
MIAAANLSKARCMSSRLSKRMRSFPNPANHPWVHSTTHRCLPSFSLPSTPPQTAAAIKPASEEHAKEQEGAHPAAAATHSNPAPAQAMTSKLLQLSKAMHQ